MREDLEAYLRNEKGAFFELPPSDTDLLAFSALMYAEFERFERFSRATSRTPIGALPRYGTLREYVEHDYAPESLYAIVAAMVESPRFASVELRDFRCIEDESRVVQFAAATFAIAPDVMVIAYRGTNQSIVGWHETVNMCWQAEGPGDEEALRYFERALEAYPSARFLLCGHSKGGAEAEHVGVFCENAQLDRIARVVSFDGPALTRCGGTACPEYDGYDELLAARYGQLPFALVRYVTPGMVGLMMENGDPHRHRYTECVGKRASHGASAVRIVDGDIVCHEPSSEEIARGLLVSRFLSTLSLDDWRLICGLAVEAFHRGSVPADIDAIPEIVRAFIPVYLVAPFNQKRAMHSIVRRFLAVRSS